MNTGYGYTIGRRHAAETDEVMRVCQDVADSYEDDKIALIAVADGKAGKNLPAAAVAAARANIDAIFSFFRDPATWHIRERNQFKETALRMLENALENIAAGEEYEFEELRATISAVAVRANGEYLAISIGDSAVIAFDADMKPKVLIPPYREGVKNRTVYTNDLDNARAHMAVRGGSLKKSQYTAFAAFTDGADSLIRRMTDGADMLRTAAACTTLGSGDEIIGKIISGISEEYTRDDVSLAVLASDTPEATAAAKAVLIERQKKSAAEVEEPTAETPEVPTEEPQATAPTEEVSTPVEQETEAEPETPPAPEVPADDGTAPTPYQATAMRAIFAVPQSAQSLTENGHIRKGRVLETVLPLIRENRIRYENGKFYGND